MTITRIMTRESHPCDNCGRIRDLTGEYPNGPMICEPCSGLFTCRCCGFRYGEYEGRAEEYEGDSDEYVCSSCRDRCPHDTPGGRCTFSPSDGECHCPSSPGAVPSSCPRCGVCNHVEAGANTELTGSGLVRCEDCGRDVEVLVMGYLGDEPLIVIKARKGD